MKNMKTPIQLNHEKHESNTGNEEIIKYKSADYCVPRKYPLTNVFDFFRASLTLGLVPRLRDVFRG